MLNIVLLVTAICIVIVLILYLFFWNRLVAFLLGIVLRLAFWNQAESSAWIDIGSIHFSILAGRILFKDLRYYSSSQTIKVVKGQLSWRYWIRRPAEEEDLSHAQVIGESPDQKERIPLQCRIHLSLQGLEWFMYNRTAAYDYIVAQMAEEVPPTPTPTPAAPSSGIWEARDALRKIFTRSSIAPDTSVKARTSSLKLSVLRKSPNLIKRTVDWIESQLPQFDPKNLLPIGIEASRGAIICGNASTPNLLVAEFSKAEGTYGVVQARSKYDHYKQVLSMKIKNALVCYVDNTDYTDSMQDFGQKVKEQMKQSSDPAHGKRNSLSFSSFQKLWNSLELWSVALPSYSSSRALRAMRSLFGYASVPVPHPPASWGWRKSQKKSDEETPVGIDFSTLEYAMERKILEAPVLELLYYADVVGLVPEPSQSSSNIGDVDPFDVGNGDLPPEWGVNVVVRGGFMRYGPWADRQRAILQQCFFPPTFHDVEPAARLKPGDSRMWTGFRVFTELRDGVTLHIPFREASKDWQWDGKVDLPNRPHRREAASIHIKAGDSSTISYIMPMVASSTGYHPLLEIHLDSVSITSSLNDIRILSAESCRLRCQLPTPLRWNAARQWTISVGLRQSCFYLLRDHINMFADLGKDWSSGPPTDYHRFVPMTYAFELDMDNYEINTYVNDHNIIDKPLIKEDNALLTLRGRYFTHALRIPLTQYHPEASTISFGIDAPDISVNLTLPRWNTHSLYPSPDRSDISRIGFLALNASYRYHAEVHEDNIDQLQLHFAARDVVFKAFGWTIRYFMILRDNYFGSFTHFSTLYEYLEKRRKGQPIGDPIDIQYRPGKSNSMEVELGVSISRGLIIAPVGLPGFGVYSAEQADAGEAGGLGPCLMLDLPVLQVQLRSNDYYMDMSLNIDTVYGHIDDHRSDDMLYHYDRQRNHDEMLLIEEIDIVANRLFGPQPHTSTYVCMWEVHIGDVKAVLSTFQYRMLSLASTSFGVNFADPLNAPAQEFAVPADPDVTFLKVTLDSANIVWRAGTIAVELALPMGIRFDSNDLAGKFHRKVNSIRLPFATCTTLLASRSHTRWYEASKVTFDVNLDIYSAPDNWQESAQAQANFISAQDALTGRARVLYSRDISIQSLEEIPSGRGILDNDMYLPQLRIPRRKQPKRPTQPTPTARLDEGLPPRSQLPLSTVNQSESDGDEGITDADRDARLARMRPAGSSRSYWVSDDGDSILSGDESDDEDLTDHWDSDESDLLQGSSHTRLAQSWRHYKAVVTQYGAHALERPSLWNGSPFTILQVARAKTQQYRVSPNADKMPARSPAPFIAESIGRSPTASAFRVHCEKGLEIWLTPLILPVVEQVSRDLTANQLCPELRFDTILANCVQSTDPERAVTKDPSVTIDIRISWVRLVSVQDIDPDKESILEDTVSSENGPHLANLSSTLLDLSIVNLHLNARLSDHRFKEDMFAASLTQVSVALGEHNSTLHRDAAGHQSPTFLVVIGCSSAESHGQEGMVCLGHLSISVGHDTPPITCATLIVMMRYISAVADAWQYISMFATAAEQQTIYQILKYSSHRTVVDPLSTIQPSYLIQSGRPDHLRKDDGFKFVVYLRSCLRHLAASERLAIIDLQPKLDQSVPLRDVISTLESRYLDHALNDDMSGLSQYPFLQQLFPPTEVPPALKENDATSPSRIILFHFEGLSFTINHQSPVGNKSRSSIIAGDIEIRAHIRSAVFQQASPMSMGKNMPSSSLRDKDHQSVQHVILSLSIGSATCTIYPQLVEFAQVLVRVQRRLASATVTPSPAPVNDRTESANKAPITPPGFYIELLISVQSLCFRAAADEIVVQLSLSHLTGAIALLSRYSKTGTGLSHAVNSSVAYHEMALRLCSASTALQAEEYDALASFIVTDGKLSGVLLTESLAPAMIRVALALNSVRFDVPRSALRLYRFVEEWRSQYLPGIRATVKNLLSELAQASDQVSSTPSKASQPSLLPIVQVQFSVLSVCITLQVMLGTWLTWQIRNSLLFAKTSSEVDKAAYSFGSQLGPHIIAISTQSPRKMHNPTARIQVELPVSTFKGRYDDSGVQSLALVEFIHVTVKPSDWDTLLSVQQKSGQDLNDLIHLIGETRQSQSGSLAQSTTPSKNPVRFSGALRVKGFRIGLEGNSSTVFLECDNINGSIDNKMDLAWQVKLSDLALSLASHSRQHATHQRGHRSAFVSVDFQADMRSQPHGRDLQVVIPKVHAVMQPASMGEFGDLVDSIQTEVQIGRDDRASERAQFREKTKNIMRSFDVKIGDTQSAELSWFDAYTISLTIKNIGVAFPLAAEPVAHLVRSDRTDQVAAVRAFLFSIKSLTFGTQHGESGQAIMKDFAFQFVPRFRQSEATDFSGGNHNTRNRLLYPEMTANLRSERAGGARRIRIGADVSGFILDLDSSIPDYVFSLIDVYRQGKDRMNRLASYNTTSHPMPEKAMHTLPAAVPTQPASLPTSNIILFSSFASGRVRMHCVESKRNSFRSGSPTTLHNLAFSFDSGIEVFDLPEVSVWGEYRATPGPKKLTGTRQESESSVLMFKGTIHSSQNTLRPSLLPFVTDIVAHVEDRMRQTGRPVLESTPARVHSLLPPMEGDEPAEEVTAPVSGMRISLSLRIDQSRLELSCQPDVNVIAGLHWDNGGFVVNVSPGARRVTFTGSVGGLTIGLKHGFLSEDCVRLDARNLAFNMTFAKMDHNTTKASNSISVVIDTEFSGGVRFSRLQDVLCFKAVWLDRIPVLTGQQFDQNAIPSSPESIHHGPPRSTSSSQELTTTVLLRFRQITLDADLGQSISQIKLQIHDLLFRTRLSDAFSELSLSIADLAILATGNISGQITTPNFRFQTIRDYRSNVGGLPSDKMLNLTMTSGVFSVELESEYQKLIHYRAEPIEVKIYDDWSAMSSRIPTEERHIDVHFTVTGSEVVVVMNVGTIPKLVSYANKFKMTLNNQREGASRESKAFRISSSPKPDNPLSAVANAMLKSTRSKLKEETGIAHAVGQQMSLKLDLLQLVIFARSMRDPELAQFIGRGVHARLHRIIGVDAFPARRDLHLSFASIATSRISQLNHALLAKEKASETKEWLAALVKDAPEATIFGLPSMDIHMDSEEDIISEQRTLRYNFRSEFKAGEGMKDAEEIYITLNMSLYAWLTSLRKAFAREMSQVQASGELRSGPIALTQQVIMPRKRGAESISVRAERDLEDLAANQQGTTWSPSPTSPITSTGTSPRVPGSPGSPSRSSTSAYPSGTSDPPGLPPPTASKTLGLVYTPITRKIERLTMRQLGEATPDVMHPFFMKKAGFSLEDSLPQYVHEYATMPTEEIMKALLELYSKQLSRNQRTDPDI
ncbi:hypothetical protein WOLCODRAFT_122406 [Wolfiporia cocos MD-104 SS10]|uniref:Csf1 N-terminal domain-containing protein n=1 Tax=Wolfiporia cocos (strain MD-104) TaxID=742152 RepID=A0A2H3K0P6_WOLCO|nr:hypothetical protein WOLCODRAFT_122406 [Wolfiporia cocos MD-104 SS10]